MAADAFEEWWRAYRLPTDEAFTNMSGVLNCAVRRAAQDAWHAGAESRQAEVEALEGLIAALNAVLAAHRTQSSRMADRALTKLRQARQALAAARGEER